MKTEKGICLNLKESDYIYELGHFRFYFSSKFYLNKFHENVENYDGSENLKLRIKYNLNIDFSDMLIIAFYKKIEKRGFYVIDTDSGLEINERVCWESSYCE